MRPVSASISRTAARREAVREASCLYLHTGFYEAYFQDIWEIAREEGRFSGDAYALAVCAFLEIGARSTRRLVQQGDDLEGLVEGFERCWPAGRREGTCGVLNVCADRDRIYPQIADLADTVIERWRAELERQLVSRIGCSEAASTMAAEAMNVLIGGYRLATVYRNRMHFARALERVRGRLLVAG